MNWVPFAFFGPIAVLCLFEPSILLWLAGFFVLVYVPAWWLLDKLIGEKPTKGPDHPGQ